MRKDGYKRITIIGVVSSLRSIARKTNLLDPERVKRYLSTAQVTEARKETLVERLCGFYKYQHITWVPPRYKRVRKLPFIPTEQELSTLISGYRRKSSTFLQLLKETGMRPGEAWALQWKDLDTERKHVSVTPEKNSNGRVLDISERCLAMLIALPKFSTYIFHCDDADPITSLTYFRRGFERTRKELALRLQQPRLNNISLKTFRHYKATMYYHQTKDILATMQLLGHRSIQNTLVYTHLVNFDEIDSYSCKVAKKVKEARELVESGFEYVTRIDRARLFRKRK
jgi:integrase